MILNKKALRKMCSVLLSVAVTITMLPQVSMTAHAASGDPAMNLGAGILKTKVNTGEAQTVHMADNTWRVMGYGGEGVASSADTLALISSGNLKTKIKFRSDYEASDANHYSKSNLKTEVDAVANTFSQGEKAGIAARTLASGTFHYTEPADCVAGDPVENALLWPLSTKEASAMSNSLRMVNHLDQHNPINTWWLRSPGNQISWAAFVIGSGTVQRMGTRVSNEYGVRPAFNYNLESIVLTTAATGGKTSGTVGANALAQVGTNGNGDWKLTVMDNSHKNFAVSKVTDTDSGVTVTYSGAATGANEYISAVITDKLITTEGAKIKYYGRIKKSANAGDAYGTLTINTGGKLGKTDYLYVFSEQFNGDKKTDFASKLQEVISPHTVHDWGEPSYTWSDDYSEVTAKRKCKTCSTEEKETVNTTPTVVKEANCKEKGEKKYTATFNNKAFNEQTKTVELPIQPNNHDWDEGEEIQAQDICGEEGILYTCKICRKTMIVGIGDHTWETKYTRFTDPTCTEQGEEFYKCSKCDAMDLERPHLIPALGHDWNAPTYKWAADNSSATASRVCGRVHSHAETETVNAVKTTKAATCTGKGKTTYTATFKNGAFGEQTKTKEIAPLGHKWDKGKVTKKATTKAAGIMTYTCTVCKAKKTKSIPKLKSTVKPVLVAKAIASGKTAGKISWNKIKSADRYVIYFSSCNYKGKKYTMKKVKTVGGKTYKWTKKKLKKNRSYKFYVVAQKKSGGKYKSVAKSKVGHFFTGNTRGKYTNPKSLKLTKSKLTLKKGKSQAIKGTVTKVKKNKKLATNHAAKLRFTSNNPTVAKVNAKGKVTAKKAGTATIYVQTINGIWKTCKVTVK